MEQSQQHLQKRDARARCLHPRMEISGEGLTLAAGTVFAKMARDERGSPCLVLDDEPRVMALLATAYDRPAEPYVLAKMRRAAELWNEGEKALAHIHLAYASLPPCEVEQALRLFVADELIDAGVTPEALMKAQGFDPAPLALLKYNPDQPRGPAGSGRESGEWTSGGAGNARESGETTRGGAGYGNESGGSSSGAAHIIPVAFRSRRERGRHRRGGVFDALHGFLEWLRGRSREKAEPAVKPFGSLESDLLRPGYGEEVPIPGLPDDIKGANVTAPRATMPNYEVDLSRSEFESELSQLGWAKEPSKDGEAMIYTKDSEKYSVRDFTASTEGPTADFFHPSGNGKKN